MVLFWRGHVRPGERVQARYISDVANAVYWQENGEDNEGHGYEYAEQELQVLEEEVAINTGDANELAVADGEDILERLDGGHGRRDTPCFGHESGLVVAEAVSTCDVGMT